MKIDPILLHVPPRALETGKLARLLASPLAMHLLLTFAAKGMILDGTQKTALARELQGLVERYTGDLPPRDARLSFNDATKAVQINA